MATISTHNGSKLSMGHNRREPQIVSKEPHIDAQGRHEVWEEMAPTVREAYSMIFGDAQDEYNAKQTRPERKIGNYYDKVMADYTAKPDKSPRPCYEMVVGVYPGEGESMTVDQRVEMLRAWFYGDKDNPGFAQRNPNMAVIGCYLHADEPDAGVHLHLDYVPVAHGYTRGMAVRNGLDRALTEQGYKTSGIGKSASTAQQQFQASENDLLSRVVEQEGYKVEHPQKGKGVEHLDTPAYKRKMLSDKEKSLSRRSRALDAKDRALASREQAIEQQEKRLTERSGEVSERASRLRAHEARLKAQEEAFKREAEAKELELKTRESEASQRLRVASKYMQDVDKVVSMLEVKAPGAAKVFKQVSSASVPGQAVQREVSRADKERASEIERNRNRVNNGLQL